MAAEREITIKGSAATIRALSADTVNQLAASSGHPELFKKIIHDMKSVADPGTVAFSWGAWGKSAMTAPTLIPERPL